MFYFIRHLPCLGSACKFVGCSSTDNFAGLVLVVLFWSLFWLQESFLSTLVCCCVEGQKALPWDSPCEDAGWKMFALACPLHIWVHKLPVYLCWRCWGKERPMWAAFWHLLRIRIPWVSLPSACEWRKVRKYPACWSWRLLNVLGSWWVCLAYWCCRCHWAWISGLISPPGLN